MATAGLPPQAHSLQPKLGITALVGFPDVLYCLLKLSGVVQQKIHWKVLVLLIPGLAAFNMGFPTGFMGIEMNYVVICCKTRL